jgi:predicted ester cyclase
MAPLANNVKSIGHDQVVVRYNSLVEHGKNFTTGVQEKSQQFLHDGVDLAINNKASKMVLSGADAFTNRVFSSIEDRVHQLSDLVKSKEQDGVEEHKANNAGQRGSLKNYQSRVLGLAQDISTLSNHLYVILK